MSDYLMRDAAPIGDEGRAIIDEMVVTVLKKNLVGRRLVPMVGPLGWGVEYAPTFGFGKLGTAAVADSAGQLQLQEIKSEFALRAKHLAMAEQTPFGLDLGAVAMAASELAKQEDKVILSGLLNAKGAGSSALGDWETVGGPFNAIAAGAASLRSTGFDAPYALLMSPAKYAQLAGLMSQGRREIEMVEKLAGAGFFQSPIMPDDQVMLVSPQAWNFDLVVGQDAVTAYIGNDGLDHLFRIFETLVLRVKRPGAVCVLK